MRTRGIGLFLVLVLGIALLAVLYLAWYANPASALTVTNVTLTGWTDNPSSNVMTSSSITGP